MSTMWPLSQSALGHFQHLFPNVLSTCTRNTAFLPPFHRSHRRKIQKKTDITSTSPATQVGSIVADLQHAFDIGKTQSIEWRRQQMRQLWTLIDENEAALQEVIYQDTGKSKLEAQLYDLGGCKNEILYMLQNFEEWLLPELPAVPEMFNAYQPAVHNEPKGVVLIIAPWNYPVVLLLSPLLGAIAAGNCAIVKPSEFTPNVAGKLAELIPKYLDSDCFRVVQGDKDVVEQILEHPLGHVFFTGSTSVGKSIMAAASRNLTPVTLELGGKSPAIVTESANIAQAARRIAWGKFLNAGQTCVAPDCVLVHESVLEQFLQELELVIHKTYAHEPKEPSKYGRIINHTHFARLTNLLACTKGTTFISTGKPDPTTLSIPPVVITDILPNDILLQSEIFGPVLPILSYKTLASASATVRQIDRTPLAHYIFSSDPSQIQHLDQQILSGATCVNDVMGQLAVTGLPASGRGNSGMGSYRGKASIECFSAKRTVVQVPTSEEFEGMLEFRYPGGDEESKYRMFKDQMEGKKDW